MNPSPLNLTPAERSSVFSWSNQASSKQIEKAIRLISGRQPLPATHPWRKYAPGLPWPRQSTFLELDCIEALYGGAAGGGKSEALLLAALEHVDVPGYSALVLRKDRARLRLSGGLIDRAQAWFAKTDAKWNNTDHCFRFPTAGQPSTIQFGYLSSPGDRLRYASSEFQLIAFDELTDFAEEDYQFLFSRLRRGRRITAPLKVRSATNPGGPGHEWVKRRFVPPSAVRDPSQPIYQQEGRAFVPARIVDNPAISLDEYTKSLLHLPTVLREQLLRGDWSIQEEGLIRREWLRYYRPAGSQVCLLRADDSTLSQLPALGSGGSWRRILTIDPAGTSQDKAREKRGRPPSWTVMQVWDLHRESPTAMLLRHTRRERVGFDGLCRSIIELHHDWRPEVVYIEDEKLGQAAVDVLRGKLPIRTIATGGQDKVARAAPLIHLLEQGSVYLPRLENGWLAALESEWLSWTGHPAEPADQIDPAAYAARIFSSGQAGGVLRMEGVFG